MKTEEEEIIETEGNNKKTETQDQSSKGTGTEIAYHSALAIDFDGVLYQPKDENTIYLRHLESNTISDARYADPLSEVRTKLHSMPNYPYIHLACVALNELGVLVIPASQRVMYNSENPKEGRFKKDMYDTFDFFFGEDRTFLKKDHGEIIGNIEPEKQKAAHKNFLLKNIAKIEEAKIEETNPIEEVNCYLIDDSVKYAAPTTSKNYQFIYSPEHSSTTSRYERNRPFVAALYLTCSLNGRLDHIIEKIQEIQNNKKINYKFANDSKKDDPKEDIAAFLIEDLNKCQEEIKNFNFISKMHRLESPLEYPFVDILNDLDEMIRFIFILEPAQREHFLNTIIKNYNDLLTKCFENCEGLLNDPNQKEIGNPQDFSRKILCLDRGLKLLNDIYRSLENNISKEKNSSNDNKLIPEEKSSFDDNNSIPEENSLKNNKSIPEVKNNVSSFECSMELNKLKKYFIFKMAENYFNKIINIIQQESNRFSGNRYTNFFTGERTKRNYIRESIKQLESEKTGIIEKVIAHKDLYDSLITEFWNTGDIALLEQIKEKIKIGIDEKLLKQASVTQSPSTKSFPIWDQISQYTCLWKTHNNHSAHSFENFKQKLIQENLEPENDSEPQNTI